MYIKREAEKKLKQMSKAFKTILVAGPRQVGKTTLLKNFDKKLNYVTLDNPLIRNQAQNFTADFINDYGTPIFIDEVQKAPNLFDYIKVAIDESDKKGLYFLCGSERFQMMKGVSESLAGRIGIINLLPLSLREIYKNSVGIPFIPNTVFFNAQKKQNKKIIIDDIFKIIQSGTMPEIIVNKNLNSQTFYSSYVDTYIEKDIKDFMKITDTIKFLNFITAIASLTGQIMNISTISNLCNINSATCERWLSILLASNIIYLLKPYSNNILKRAIKTPKLYFLDTGLACYLLKWNNSETLKNGAMSGAIFETFVISEIIKSYYNAGISEPPIYFYRDKEQKEIDLIIEDNGTLYPIEIKKHLEPNVDDVKSFSILEKISNVKVGSGAVICPQNKIMPLTDKVKIVPITMI